MKGKFDQFAKDLEAIGVDPVGHIKLATERLQAILKGGPPDELERWWYLSLNAGVPDYGIYSSPLYLAEAWACWYVYAREYVKRIKTHPAVEGVRSIVDLGCGIGYSTADLVAAFPGARVVATQIPGSLQAQVAAEVARQVGFELVERGGGPRELVFASEYFEHFPDPLAHLREVLDEYQPRVFVCANTFSSMSAGHFDSYAGKTGPQTARDFGAALRAAGFKAALPKFWNNRPQVWVR